MSTWSSIKTSWNQSGPWVQGLPYHEGGVKAAFKAAKMQGQEGLLHSIKRAFAESAGWDPHMTVQGPKGPINYGGGILSKGGWREVKYGVEKTGSGAFKLGAQRSAKSMFGKGLWKFGMPAFSIAMFAHNVQQEGLVSASVSAAKFNIGWGAARWGLARLGMGLANPLTLAAGAIAGTAFGVQAAMRAGRDYNKKVRIASFGNAAQDPYGTVSTMRQASVNAIQGSKLNGRSALGSEAQLFHQ